MKDGARRRLFLLIAAMIPVAFLLLAEGALRLFDFGASYPLFVQFEPDPSWLQPNPDVVKRFFATPGAAPDVSIDSGFFLADKPAGALRVVVQGGSSAAGFPYGKHASPAWLLQQRLRRTFPGQEVEVVQTAMAAVNSYALLDFVDEIIAIEPDAVVLYAGHNEYLGILGVGSSYGPGARPGLTRLLLHLRDLRLYQFAQRLVATMLPEPARRTGTLMATIARERSIALGSPLFDRGVAQFRANLARLLARYAQAGVPVFIGTLASNEKDQPPFMGQPDDDSPSWHERRTALRTQLDGSDPGDAIGLAEALVALAPEAADAHFLLGRAALASNEPGRARAAFTDAIDRDRLRFRAPSVFESVIRSAAAAHGATVVETHGLLAAASPAAIIGSELMLEHLHPNKEGYFLLADAFYDALAAHGLGRDWRTVGETQARSEHPLTRVENLHGEYRVTQLMHDWPFVETRRTWEPPPPRTEEQRIAQSWYRRELDWTGAMNAALVNAQRTGDYTEAARIATNLADAFPFEAQPQHLAGAMLVSQDPPDGLRALPYFHRAARLAPDNADYLATLAKAYWLNGYRDAARQAAQRLERVAPSHPLAREILSAATRE